MADSTSVVSALIEMGFPPDKAEEASKAAGSAGLQRAMDLILAQDGIASTEEKLNDPSIQPKSLKCEDCGKILRSEVDAQAHAARTSHQNFAESTKEIKPLTPEEKAAQLAKLEEKMKQKRIAREQQEKKDVKEREKLRRKGGKELTEIKQKMELTEMKKMAEERKRQKAEDRMARQKVREQIARDREEREASSQSVAVVQQQPSCDVKKDYSLCRLQIRLMDGTATVQSFTATDTLQDVLIHLGLQGARLMTTFPKRIFTSEDQAKSLKDLGLVPSAVLIQMQNN